jgi:hypothetical protein
MPGNPRSIPIAPLPRMPRRSVLRAMAGAGERSRVLAARRQVTPVSEIALARMGQGMERPRFILSLPLDDLTR